MIFYQPEIKLNYTDYQALLPEGKVWVIMDTKSSKITDKRRKLCQELKVLKELWKKKGR